MVARVLGLYVLIELAAVVALSWAVGVGWALLILFGALIAGFLLSGSQIRKQLELLRSGATKTPGSVTDGVLVAAGSLLVIIPGLVTFVLGALLLLPPTRFVVRPAVVFLATRMFERSVPLVTAAAAASAMAEPRKDYVDGEVVDVKDIRPAEITQFADPVPPLERDVIVPEVIVPEMIVPEMIVIDSDGNDDTPPQRTDP